MATSTCVGMEGNRHELTEFINRVCPKCGKYQLILNEPGPGNIPLVMGKDKCIDDKPHHYVQAKKESIDISKNVLLGDEIVTDINKSEIWLEIVFCIKCGNSRKLCK